MSLETALNEIIKGLNNGNQMCLWTVDAQSYCVKIYDNNDLETSKGVQLLVDPMLLSHDIKTVCKFWESALKHNKDNRNTALKVIQDLRQASF
jgi:hypothetical protein